jgi:uncharacterized protein YggU (UPF0235/DUF167 family)
MSKNLAPYVDVPIYVQPKAAKNAYLGIVHMPMPTIHHQTRAVFKLSVRAPAQQYAANDAACALMAALLCISRSSVCLIQGAQSRHKVLRISPASDDVQQALRQLKGELALE